MARPPKSNNQRPRRDEILDEATRLFAERGYEGASMADLAEAVGMRKASLFYHFASKEVLYTAVLDRLLVSLREAILTAAATEGTFEVRLDALSDGVTGVLGSQPFAARLLLREVMDWGPVIRGNLAESLTAVLNAARAFAEEGQKEGVFAEGDPNQLILSILGVYFLPFAVTGLTSRMTGREAYEPELVEERRAAARLHTRSVAFARAQKAAQQ